MIARVVPLTRTRAVRGSFDYRLGDRHADVEVGAVLRVPFGRQRALGVVVGLARDSELAPDRLVEPDEVLGVSVPPDLVELAEWMAREYCSTTARALSLMLPAGLTAGRGVKRSLVAELTPAGGIALDDAQARLTPHQRELLATLARSGATVASELGTGSLRRLESRGLVAIDARVRPRRPARRPLGSAAVQAPALTGDQRAALAELVSAFEAPERRRFLLHGVTGSGKTEVYLHAVQTALESGRGAIVLVPEIALTPQVLWRFQARFGDVVAVLHSALGAGERHDEWLRLRKRRGAGLRRSALGGVRAGHRSGIGDRRRGARGLLQARGRPPLRRAQRRCVARGAVGGGAGVRQRHAAPRERRLAQPRCGCPSASTGARSPRSRCSTCAAITNRCIPKRGSRSATCAARVARRSCCSTVAAGRTSCPAAPAAASGCARTATSRSCCTGTASSSPVTTAVIER